MRINRYLCTLLIPALALVAPSTAHAQGGGRPARAWTSGERAWTSAEIVNVEPMENVPAIAGAPFSADATTEFTQTLSDGNRIERRFTTSMARDGRGRTRSEQEVAMLGPLFVLQNGASVKFEPATRTAAQNEPPRFTVITDPIDGTTYTLDERSKEARRGPFKPAFEAVGVGVKLEAAGRGPVETTESLGTRQIEGVSAEGTRVTTTIPAGQIGNLNPIQMVTERWYSKDLRMAVLITRRDPRSGDTVYRLSNIVRNEPPPDLFTVPSDYRIVDISKRLDDARTQMEKELKKLDKARTGGQEQ